MSVGDYVTQIGPDGSGHERCGAACVASVLLSEGWQSDPFGLCCEVADKAGITDQGATSDDLLNVAATYGFSGGKWTTQAEGLDCYTAGHAVLALLDNHWLTPRAYPPGAQWNALHWIRLFDRLDQGEMWFCYDPLTYLYQPSGPVYQNPTVYLSGSIWNGIKHTTWPESGIFLMSPSGKNLNG